MGKLGKGDEKLLVKHVSCLEHEQEEEEELASLGDWTETVLKEKEEVVQNEDQREQLFLSW